MVNLRLRISDLCSFELTFVLFLFAGAYKSAPLVAELDAQVDVTVLTMLVSVLAGLATLRNGLRFPTDRQLSFVAAYGVLVMLAMGSYAVTAQGEQGPLLKLQKLVVFNTFAVCVPVFIINSSQRVERLLRLILTFAMVVAVQAVFSSRMGEDIRFVGAFGTEHYHALGHSAGMALVIVCAALLGERRRLDRLVLAGLAATATFAMFLSSTRQALVGVFPALPILLPLLRQNRFRLVSVRRFLTVAACAVLLFFVVRDYFFAGTDLDHIWARMLAIFDGHTGDVIVESDRPVLWADGLELWLAHPLFGAGFGGFPLVGKTGVRHPHNYFFELLAELGAVGFVFGVLLVVLAAVSIVREFRAGPAWPLVTVRAVWGFLFTCAMLSGDLTDNRMMFAFMALCLVRDVLPATDGRRAVARLLEAKPAPPLARPPVTRRERAEPLTFRSSRQPGSAVPVRRAIVPRDL